MFLYSYKSYLDLLKPIKRHLSPQFYLIMTVIGLVCAVLILPSSTSGPCLSRLGGWPQNASKMRCVVPDDLERGGTIEDRRCVFPKRQNHMRSSVNTMRKDAKIFNLFLENPSLLNGLLPKNIVNSYDYYGIEASADISSAKKALPPHVVVTAYVVKPGDTLSLIASRFALRESTLLCSNSIAASDALKPGMVLRVPDRDGLYIRINDFDTLSLLAKEYGSTVKAIISSNALAGGAAPVAGTELFIPGGEAMAVAKGRNGYNIIGKLFANDFIHPLNGTISSQFGWRADPFTYGSAFHSGLDIRGTEGSTITASASGRVIFAGWKEGYGLTAIIRHQNGLDTLYGHCSVLLVNDGDDVKRGEVIARVGSTGRTTGPHLHFEVRKNNVPIDSAAMLWK